MMKKQGSLTLSMLYKINSVRHALTEFLLCFAWIKVPDLHKERMSLFFCLEKECGKSASPA